MKITAMIPARYDSMRFPGKALADIGGKPMIQRVWEGASAARSVSRVIVATDDDRIIRAVTDFGGEAVMTPRNCQSGTDRIAGIVGNIETDIVVNIQGDEPFIEPEEIDQVADILLRNPDAAMGTLVKKITETGELTDPNVVKAVVDGKGRALYFSRHPVPYFQNAGSPDAWLSRHIYYKHVGIYSYRKDFLLRFAQAKPTPLEMAESLEQLRVLELGYDIVVEETGFDPIGVDTAEDLEKARAMVRKRKDGR